MEKDLFTKLLKAYDFLSQDRSVFNKRFQNDYLNYDIGIKDYSEKFSSAINNFHGKTIREFFDEEYLKSKHVYFADKYLDLSCLDEDKYNFKIQYEVPRILYYYLFNYFKEDIATFLNVLKSEEFRTKFKFMLSIEKYSIEYNLNYHEELVEYLKTVVPNFYNVYWLCASSAMMIYASGNTGVIKIHQIENCLKNANTVYNFKDIEFN